MISRTQSLTAVSRNLADGQWHHIAAVMPGDSCKLSAVEIYVDGQSVETQLSGADESLYFNQSMRLGIGGLNYSSKAFDALEVEPLVGFLDEVSIWTRSLSEEDVTTLYR